MILQHRTVAPEYNSFYIAGRRGVNVPIDFDHGFIASSSECITVPCLYWNEGDTSITLGRTSDLDRVDPPRFEGDLQTPQRRVLLFDANMPEIMSMVVPGAVTRIRIWTNDPREPDEVTIGVG